MKTITLLAMLVCGAGDLAGVMQAAEVGGPTQMLLRRQIESMPDGWVGYELQTNGENRMYCSFDDSINITNNRGDRHAASARIRVYFRVTAHHIDRVRLRSDGCDLDAEGRQVTWLNAVDPNASVALLDELVRSDTEDAKHALVALAISRGSSDRLIDIARHHPSSSLRGKALFWVGQQAGEKAAATLKDAVNNDPEDGVKAKAVFGIYNLPDDQSVPMLIDLMKTHPSRAVRKKAAFWLSQKDDPRALAAFQEILTK
jgi:HEAT repeat protein